MTAAPARREWQAPAEVFQLGYSNSARRCGPRCPASLWGASTSSAPARPRRHRGPKPRRAFGDLRTRLRVRPPIDRAWPLRPLQTPRRGCSQPANPHHARWLIRRCGVEVGAKQTSRYAKSACRRLPHGVGSSASEFRAAPRFAAVGAASAKDRRHAGAVRIPILRTCRVGMPPPTGCFFYRWTSQC